MLYCQEKYFVVVFVCSENQKGTGANPTDRAKSGTKRSMVVDDKGVPLGITVDAVNRHDMKMTKATLQSIVVHRSEPTTRAKQHMCMDNGYDFPEVHELLEDYGYTIHIKLRIWLAPLREFTHIYPIFLSSPGD